MFDDGCNGIYTEEIVVCVFGGVFLLTLMFKKKLLQFMDFHFHKCSRESTTTGPLKPINIGRRSTGVDLVVPFIMLSDAFGRKLYCDVYKIPIINELCWLAECVKTKAAKNNSAVERR